MVELEADCLEADPQTLNRALKNGELDISSVSSFFYIQNPDHILVPEISISTLDSVGSVLFFHKKPLSQLGGKPLSVPKTSATSIRILNLLLLAEGAQSIEFEVVDVPDIRDERFDGTLIIGDEAMRVDPDWSTVSDRIDLGTWWTRRFSLPMVFGIWVANPDWAEQNGDKLRHISSALARAKNIGTGELLPDVIAGAEKMTGLSSQRVEKYFTEELDYNLTEEHIESLGLFRRLCKEHDLITT